MLVEYIKPFTIWLHLHPHLTYLFVFLVAFTESLAIIGTLVPGSVTMAAIGVLIGSGVIPMKSTFLAGIIGAMLGDGLSFWVGYHYKDRLRECWPFSRYPQMLKQGEVYFHRHGGKSIVIGRFVGPVRSVIPVVAGMLNMPIRTYLIADVVSSLFWAPAYMLPGILVGAASLQLAPKQATWFVAVILISALAIVVSFWGLHQLIGWAVKRYSDWLDRFWQHAQQQGSAWSRWLQYKNAPKDHQPFVLVILILICFTAFVFLASQIATQGMLTTWNQPLHHLLQSLRTPEWDHFMLLLTFFGDKLVLLPVALLLGIWLCLQKCQRAAVYWWGNMLVSAGLIEITKRIVQSARPLGNTVIRAGFSFPSGHTVLAVTLFGVFAGLVSWQTEPDRRRWLIIMTAVWCGAIALSRLYLGQHWLTDVIGSAFLGAGIATTTTLLLRRDNVRLPSSKKLIPVALSLLMIAWSWNIVRHFPSEQQHTQPHILQHSMTFMQWWQQRQPILPLHRRNRLGKPAESLNIQFAGNLAQFTKTLEQQKWHLVKGSKFLNRLSRLAKSDQTQTLPFWPKLYDYQHPAIEITQHLPGAPILIVRLWPSNYHFQMQSTPLWIGSVHYRILWHHLWLHHHQTLMLRLKDPLDQLTKALSKQYKWRKLTFHTPQAVEVVLLHE